MTAKTALSAPKRRTRAEVQQLVPEFVSRGMRRSEFCQSRGLSVSTLGSPSKETALEKKAGAKVLGRSFGAGGVGGQKSPKQQEPSCGLAVVAAGRAPDRGVSSHL